MKGGLDPNQLALRTKGLEGVREVSKLKGNNQPSATEFKELLDRSQLLPKNGLLNPEKVVNPQIKFSNHAVERMMHRGIHFSNQDLARLESAIGKAESKGAKDTLVLLNDSALIVSVKNKTVVTVMDKNALKENVFTNIDSTVVI